MAQLFAGDDCLGVWQAVSKHLLGTSSKSDFDVLVTIKNPCAIDSSWLTRFDPKRINNKVKSIRDVSNTIFPLKTLKNSENRKEFYERYMKTFAKGAHRTPTAWGTYFKRLICFGPSKANQLEAVIEAMNRWKNNYRAAFVFHLSSPHLDIPRPLGAPCWQFGQLTSSASNKLDLHVTYRSHDYFSKTLGNFIGLSRLLSFICRETKRKPGLLVCHSINAYFDTSKNSMERLILGS